MGVTLRTVRTWEAELEDLRAKQQEGGTRGVTATRRRSRKWPRWFGPIKINHRKSQVPDLFAAAEHVGRENERRIKAVAERFGRRDADGSTLIDRRVFERRDVQRAFELVFHEIGLPGRPVSWVTAREVALWWDIEHTRMLGVSVLGACEALAAERSPIPVWRAITARRLQDQYYRILKNPEHLANHLAARHQKLIEGDPDKATRMHLLLDALADLWRSR